MANCLSSEHCLSAEALAKAGTPNTEHCLSAEALTKAGTPNTEHCLSAEAFAKAGPLTSDHHPLRPHRAARKKSNPTGGYCSHHRDPPRPGLPPGQSRRRESRGCRFDPLLLHNLALFGRPGQPSGRKQGAGCRQRGHRAGMRPRPAFDSLRPAGGGCDCQRLPSGQ